MNERVVVTMPVYGDLCHMQVCVESEDVTDEEILAVCNRENPCGTRKGWSTVWRMFSDCPPSATPMPCSHYEGRLHMLVVC